MGTIRMISVVVVAVGVVFIFSYNVIDIVIDIGTLQLS